MTESSIQIDRYRSRVLELSLYGLGLLYLLALVLRHMSVPVKPIAIVVYLTLVLGLVALGILVRKERLSYKAGSNAFLVLITSTVVVITLVSSGFIAPVLAVLILVPVLGAFFLGLKGCVAYLIVSLMILSVSYWLDSSGYSPTSPLSLEQLPRAKLIVYSFIILGSALVAIAYEYNRVKTQEYLATLNEKLEEERNKAERSLQTKSQFLANISHEIRTPLNGILGMVTILGDSLKDEKILKHLKTIEFSGESLLTMVNDLLDQAKLESGKFELECLAFDPVEQLNNVIDVFSTQTKNQKIDIFVEVLNPIDTKVLGDPVRYSQVLFNLIGNAVKFSNHKNVFVKIDFTAESSTSFRVQVDVADLGIGISEEAQSRLFQPFIQADASTTRQFGGTGLGLSICKGILENMGGSIWVSSNANQGSTFGFDFVAEIFSEQEEHQRQEGDQIASTDINFDTRVLVAEDNSVNRTIVEAYLDKLGFTADYVCDGEQAVEAVKKKKYDMLLMDCHMPRLDGFEATRQIISQCGESRPQIIALTASAQKTDRERCEEAGMDGFISKPLRLEDLQKTLVAVSANQQNPVSRSIN